MSGNKAPLAHRMRPVNLDNFIGQEEVISKGKPLRNIIESKEFPSSIIFWGPPGCGKTTLARIIASRIDADISELSAVNAGKKDIEKTIQKSSLFGRRKILFLDEIHRFNKAQQDFLLPYVERGTITLIGATTENPSFEVIPALLSRSRVFILKSLGEEDLIKIINNALTNKEKGMGNKNIIISEDNKKLIANLSNGDARSALNILESSFLSSKSNEITREIILNSTQKVLKYDKDGEEHYNIISALHKSMRDSDVQASVYWTMRMIEGGEDPKYIIRRMIRFASEDIGNKDPQALQVAVAAKEAVEFLGYPECDTALIQTAVYLAKAPKSNASYVAVQKSKADIKRTGNLSVPLHLRNAPTKFMKDIGYGNGYKYAHDYKDSKVDQKHMPDELEGSVYYEEK